MYSYDLATTPSMPLSSRRSFCCLSRIQHIHSFSVLLALFPCFLRFFFYLHYSLFIGIPNNASEDTSAMSRNEDLRGTGIILMYPCIHQHHRHHCAKYVTSLNPQTYHIFLGAWVRYLDLFSLLWRRSTISIISCTLKCNNLINKIQG